MDTITVVGVHRDDGGDVAVSQLVGPNVTRDRVASLLTGVQTLYTYNGARFDLVFLRSKIGLELEPSIVHEDLMYTCWRQGLYGGLKSVERCLGIERTIKDVSGLQAVALWWRYVRQHDEDALKRLLRYNAEDVLNLKVLRERLLTD